MKIEASAGESVMMKQKNTDDNHRVMVDARVG